MKIKIYVLSTVLVDENGPAMPALFADETEARAKYDEVMRWEWDSMMDPDIDGPYPGDPYEAQERIRRAHGAEWSRWELRRHDIKISATRYPEPGQSTSASSPLPLQLVQEALSRFA